MARILRVFLSLFLLLTAGCITHNVVKDYPTYLRNNPSPTAQFPANLNYTLAPSFDRTPVRIIAASVGAAHRWYVDLSAIIPDYLQAQGLRPAAAATAAGPSAGADVLVLDTAYFSFADGTAHVDLSVSLSHNHALVLSKQYSGDGNKQLGRMFAAGPLGMTRVVLSSTTAALDKIFAQVASDLRHQK